MVCLDVALFNYCTLSSVHMYMCNPVPRLRLSRTVSHGLKGGELRFHCPPQN